MKRTIQRQQTTNASDAQRGIALMMALLITALVAMVAVELVARQHFDIRRTANILETDQAYMYSLGIESVMTKLVQTASKAHPTYNDINELETLNASPPFPVDGGAVAFHIDDMEGRFNINNIVNDKGEKEDTQFQLLQFFITKSGMPMDFADAVLDWVDKDTLLSGIGGAEDGEYLGMQPAYRPPNRRMASASELMLVKGFKDPDPDKMKERMQIFKWVTALPDTTPININTASEEVLQVVFQKFAPQLVGQVGTIITDRKQNPIKSSDDFTKLTVFDSLKDAKVKGETVDSLKRIFDRVTNYFLVTANAVVGQSNNQLSSLMMCTTTTCDHTVVIARSQGTPGMF